jgi:type IV pilus assembly protein PilC
MPTYKYVAVNLQKKKYKGLFIAENEADLAVQLTKQNLYLVSATVYKGGTPSAFFTLGTGKVSISELTTFCRQFAIMLTTGIPLLNCIDILKQQSFSGYFKSILQVVSEDIKGGAMLSESLDKHKKVFPDFFRSMVHIGEASGKLETIFIALAEYYETDTSIKRKAKSALSYPMLLMAMTVGIAILMLAVVIPTFRDALSDLEVEIEGITKVVYDISDFVLANWRMLVIGVILGGCLLYLFCISKTGKKTIDILKIKTPIIGALQTSVITARFARAFSILLSSGMDLATALDNLSIILGNTYVESRFNEAADDVRQGITLTNAFQKQKLFPPMMLQMLAVGEQTASLEEVLMRSCKFFDEQVETSLNSFTSKIQPIMLIIMGAVIGTMFLAVYSPMLSIMTSLT